MNLRRTQLLCACTMAALLPLTSGAQLEMVSQSLPNPDNTPAPCFPVPTERQVKWNETEFYAFYHYGMNTYTGLEWGNGNEDVNLFAPTAVPDTRQWLEAAKSAGMKGGIAVIKHHDGFCLWPTETTDHSVKSCTGQYASQTNIPKSFAEAAKALGMKYGFYISPWDRNSGLYGTDDYVTKVFLKQCEEVAQYGSDQFEMWFDGANGGSGYYGGKNTSISVDRGIYYDIPNLNARIHKLAPLCLMWGVGGEARWIGNEAGWAGETNWSFYNGNMYNGSVNNAGNDATGVQPYGRETDWKWNAGEVDAKSTGGWFYHDGETVKDANTLFKMYLESVGRNATFILNIPPGKDGKLPQATVNRMKELGDMIKARLGGTDYAKSAQITADVERTAGANRNYGVSHLTDGDSSTYWGTNDDVRSAVITLQWDSPVNVHYVQLMEPIRLGQRIRAFHIEYSADGSNWTKAPGTMTTVGYKRILPLNGSTSNYGSGYSVKAIRLTIDDSRACPLLSNLSVF